MELDHISKQNLIAAAIGMSPALKTGAFLYMIYAIYAKSQDDFFAAFFLPLCSCGFLLLSLFLDWVAKITKQGKKPSKGAVVDFSSIILFLGAVVFALVAYADKEWRVWFGAGAVALLMFSRAFATLASMLDEAKKKEAQ